MTDEPRDDQPTPEKAPYEAPDLTRHGDLEELTSQSPKSGNPGTDKVSGVQNGSS